jgi:uncharacterized membrane protein
MDMDLLHLLLGTLLLRPYVFVFLAVFLVLAVPAWGWRRTLLYALLGYGLAWMAEYSSTHNGFPFGLYTYLSAPTLDKELWVAGVPFMDSLSFVFLSYAGLQTARLILEPLSQGPLGSWDIRWKHPGELPSWAVWFLGGVLTMGLDIVIDPLTLQGERWFLGQIYFYPGGGSYFGVPLSNFVGWALLAWSITGGFLLLERLFLQRWWGAWRGYFADALPAAGLFIGVLVFNLAVTFAIREYAMAAVGLVVGALLVSPIFLRLQKWRAQSEESIQTKLSSHEMR